MLLATFCVAAALPATASAQEAPGCLEAAEKLSDNVDHWKGTNGKDSVTGLRGEDRMNGGGGDDFINGGRNNDVVKGGPGDDLLCGGRGHDVIYGGDGDDVIYGEEENDRIIPGPGDDKVLGSAGNDRILGWGKQGGKIVDDGIDLLEPFHAHSRGSRLDDLIDIAGVDAADREPRLAGDFGGFANQLETGCGSPLLRGRLPDRANADVVDGLSAAAAICSRVCVERPMIAAGPMIRRASPGSMSSWPTWTPSAPSSSAR